MLHYDAVKNPDRKVLGTKERDTSSFLVSHPYEFYSFEELTTAKNLIVEEYQKVVEEHGKIDEESWVKSWENTDKRLLFLVNEGRFGSLDEASKRDICDYLEKKIDGYGDANAKLNKKLEKMDNKMGLLTAGYRKRINVMTKQLEESEGNMEQANCDLNSFEFLRRKEDVAVTRRLTVRDKPICGTQIPTDGSPIMPPFKLLFAHQPNVRQKCSVLVAFVFSVYSSCFEGSKKLCLAIIIDTPCPQTLGTRTRCSACCTSVRLKAPLQSIDYVSVRVLLGIIRGCFRRPGGITSSMYVL